MALTDKTQSPNNPILNAAALARVSSYGTTSAVEAGVVVVEQGEPMDRFLVVIDGEIAVTQNIRGGIENVTTHAAGQFFGDVHSLSGRPCLAGGRMITAGHIVTLDRSSLQRLMQSDSELGELFMRAFILRRIDLLANSNGNSILLGSENSALSRNVNG